MSEEVFGDPKPLGALVLVELDEFVEKTKGGILLPTITKETTFMVTGKVIAVGEGYWNTETNTHTPLAVKEGDRILFVKQQCYLWVDPETNKQYWFVNVGNIMAVLRKGT